MDTQLATITTDLGTFTISLDREAAPVTAGYFCDLIQSGALDGTSVFRIVNGENSELRAETPIHVVQAGLKEQTSPYARSIVHEDTQTTGLGHKKWAVSAAREAVGENYASFFICMRDEPSLDFGGARHPDGQGFAVFGHIIKGFDVVAALFERAESTEYLDHPISIISARMNLKS